MRIGKPVRKTPTVIEEDPIFAGLPPLANCWGPDLDRWGDRYGLPRLNGLNDTAYQAFLFLAAARHAR